MIRSQHPSLPRDASDLGFIRSSALICIKGRLDPVETPRKGQQRAAGVPVYCRWTPSLFTVEALEPCVSPVSADRQGQLIFT